MTMMKTLLILALTLLVASVNEVTADVSSRRLTKADASSKGTSKKDKDNSSSKGSKGGKKVGGNGSKKSSKSDGICSSDCFDSRPGTGCSDAMCTAKVGTADSYCIDTEWDPICVRTACEECGGTDAGCEECLQTEQPSVSSAPSMEPCMFQNGTDSNCFLEAGSNRTTCDDMVCQEAVYALDANSTSVPNFCKEQRWDRICVRLACQAPECAGLEKGCLCDDVF